MSSTRVPSRGAEAPLLHGIKIDETLQAHPGLRQWRPAVGIAPKLTDAELVTLAVLQALLG